MKALGVTAVIVATAMAAACSSWPSMPKMPSLPSFSFKTEGPEARPAISCEAAARLDLRGLDWPRAKQLEVQIRNAKFTPDTLIMQVNTPNVVRVVNADKSVRTFRAEEFFRAAAVARIVYAGQALRETCIDAIKVGPLKWAEIEVVPLRQGDYLFGEDTSSDLPLTPFETKKTTGQIIVR